MSNTINDNLYIRKSEHSDEWECGYMVYSRKGRELTWLRNRVCKKPNYEEAEHWLNEQGKLNISQNKKVF